MLDSLMNSAAGFMEKVSRWISFPAIPWSEFQPAWNQLIDTIAPWNRIFPITDAITIIGLILAFTAALMILFTIAFIKSFIPMSGGK